MREGAAAVDATDLREEARRLGRDLRRAIPDTYGAYGRLHSSVLAPGALGTGTKELIALAIAVTRECDGCIAAHAEAAVRNGVTAGEVAEALGVAILMNGGPATVYGPRAYRAFRDFAAVTSDSSDPAHVGDERRTPAPRPPAHTVGTPDHPTEDDRMNKILHDLEVANDCGPAHRAHVHDS